MFGFSTVVSVWGMPQRYRCKFLPSHCASLFFVYHALTALCKSLITCTNLKAIFYWVCLEIKTFIHCRLHIYSNYIFITLITISIRNTYPQLRNNFFLFLPILEINKTVRYILFIIFFFNMKLPNDIMPIIPLKRKTCVLLFIQSRCH